MHTIDAVMEKHYRSISYSMAFVIVFFAAARMFHDVNSVCHYLFGFDHAMHVVS